jgi:hypothetical protein
MKRIADEAMGAWLATFSPEPEAFEWDHGNRPKLAKHRVRVDEAEQVFRHAYCPRRTHHRAGARGAALVGARPDGRRAAADHHLHAARCTTAHHQLSADAQRRAEDP